MKIKLPNELASKDPVDIDVDDFAIRLRAPLFLRDTEKSIKDESFHLRFIALVSFYTIIAQSYNRACLFVYDTMQVVNKQHAF
jgi:hypothetical protein